MSIVHGDILEITFNHPTLGSGIFNPKSTEDTTYDLGGFRSDDNEDGVDGAGNMIDRMTRKRWSFEAPIAWDANNAETLEKLNALAASPVQAQWTITSINGTVYGGQGKPVGDLKGNGANGTIQLKVSGGGKLKKV